MSPKNLIIAVLALAVATLACGGDPVLDRELSTLVPAAATEAAELPDAVVESAAQTALDNGMTTVDLAWGTVTGTVPCRNPREIPVDSLLFEPDEFGFVEGIQCGPLTPSEANGVVEFDLAAVGVVTLATPGFAGDDVIAYIKIGADVLILVGAKAAAELIGRGYVESRRRHTDWEHNPNREGSEARTKIGAVLASWATLLTGGPNGPKVQCGELKEGETLIRTVIYVLSGPLKGLLAVYSNVNSFHPWVSGYIKDGESFTRGPDPKKLPQGWTWTPGTPCPEKLPELQTATATN